MANNYTQATVTPTNIPLTREQKEVLCLLGFGCEDSTQADDESPRYYIYIEDSFQEPYEDGLDEISPEAVEYLRRILEPGESETLASVFEAYDAASLFDRVMQDVIAYTDGLEVVTIQGADTCSKLRPGEFGGFAGVITKNNS